MKGLGQQGTTKQNTQHALSFGEHKLGQRTLSSGTIIRLQIPWSFACFSISYISISENLGLITKWRLFSKWF